VLGITNREFPGKIKSEDDPKNRGRYLVHIPELMYTIFDTNQDGIYCANHTHKWRDTYKEVGNEKKFVGGSYYPLKTGTRVIIKFFSEDYESGYIDRIVSDYYEDGMPVQLYKKEKIRDKYYQVLRTSKNDLIAISTIEEKEKEESEDTLPLHSIHMYYDKDKVEVICNPDGMFIFVKEDLQIEVEKEIRVKSEELVYVRGGKVCIEGTGGMDDKTSDVNQSSVIKGENEDSKKVETTIVLQGNVGVTEGLTVEGVLCTPVLSAGPICATSISVEDIGASNVSYKNCPCYNNGNCSSGDGV
jgi:hypothetical protein